MSDRSGFRANQSLGEIAMAIDIDVLPNETFNLHRFCGIGSKTRSRVENLSMEARARPQGLLEVAIRDRNPCRGS